MRPTAGKRGRGLRCTGKLNTVEGSSIRSGAVKESDLEAHRTPRRGPGLRAGGQYELSD